MGEGREGAQKIRELLARRLDGDIRVPAKSTIHAVLDRHGLVKRAGGPPQAPESGGGASMARSIERLSAAKVSKAKPGMYCGGGGLYLQATLGADGEIKKSWIFRFALHGRERQMGLGSCGDVTLAQARKKATGYREQSRKGSTRSTRATFPGPPLWQGTPSPRASTSAPPSASRLKGPAGARQASPTVDQYA